MLNVITILFIAYSSVINRLRGKDFENKYVVWATSKLATSCYMGFGVYLLTADPYLGIITWLGIWLWAVLGWGSYFSAFTGGPMLGLPEVYLIDKLADKVLGIPDTPAARRRWGTFAMSIRGLMIVPLFIAYAVYLGQPMIGLLGLGGLLQGFVYGAMRWVPIHRIATAEYIMGGVIGGLIAIAL